MLSRQQGKSRTCCSEQGSALLEGLIAVLIFSFGILALVGLQANSMRIATESKMRIDASYIANQQLGLMWSDLENLASFVGEEDVSTLPNGKVTTAVNGDQVTVTVTCSVPGDAQTYSFQNVARIKRTKAP